jgi:hypothetical protein
LGRHLLPQGGQYSFFGHYYLSYQRSAFSFFDLFANGQVGRALPAKINPIGSPI